MAKRKAKRKSTDVEIKIKNLDKVIKNTDKKKGWCGMTYGGQNGGGHFWMFGSALAMVLSYERSGAILWAILHGVLSWFYVLFRAMQIWGWF